MNSAGKPIKPIKLVLEAIHNLRAQKGFTTKEITNYMFSNHNINERMIKSVMTALKRGTDYGILQHNNYGRYSICESPTSRMVLLKKGINSPDCFARMRKRKSRSRCGRKRRRRSHSRCGGKRRRSHRRRRSRRSQSKCGGRRHKRRSHRRRRSRSACGSKKRRRSHRRSRGCGGKRRHRSRRRRSPRRKC